MLLLPAGVWDKMTFEDPLQADAGCGSVILFIAWIGLLTFGVIPHCFLLRYQDDFGPVLEGCTCYCCQRHTRAYVHHLLVTNELLAGVLLMMHNFQHYFSFFSAIQDALRDNKLDQLKNLVFKQALQGPPNAKPGQWAQIAERRLQATSLTVGLCKVDCQQGHLDLLIVKCLPSWRELKEAFEEDLTSSRGRKTLFKQLISLLHSWGKKSLNSSQKTSMESFVFHYWSLGFDVEGQN